MKTLFYIIAFLFCSLQGFSQDYSSTIKEGVERFTKSIKIERFDIAVGMIHPSIVEKGGGAESMEGILSNEQEMLTLQGFEIIETTTLLPLELVKTKENLHCLVPQLTILKIGEAKFNSKRWILASSPDEGKNWYYVNLDAYNNESIKIFFPNWNSDLKIPVAEPAMMIEE